MLPKRQLLGQYRELCAITKEIAINKTPGHALVNKIVQYPAWMYYRYLTMVQEEFKRRGYRMLNGSLYTLHDNAMLAEENGYFADDDLYDFNTYMMDPFPDWHNDRYLRQCYFNLQEKYDCGLITEQEWYEIESYVDSLNVMIYY